MTLYGCKTAQAPTGKPSLKTNGLYYFYKAQSKNPYYACYRFYADGTIINGSFTSSPAEIWEEFDKGRMHAYAQSTYRIRNNSIHMIFYDDKKEKTHEMKGTIGNEKILFKIYHQTSEPSFIYEEQIEVKFLPLE